MSKEKNSSNSDNMYSNFKICSALKVQEKCFRLHEYKEGGYKEIFHEHVPKRRVNDDDAYEFMKALVARHSGLNDSQILSGYLNKRPGQPRSIPFCRGHVEYPEPGVMRKYCSGGDLNAWVDEVLIPEHFRKNNAKAKAE